MIQYSVVSVESKQCLVQYDTVHSVDTRSQRPE